MLEEYEEIVENWYFHHQEERLDRFFCATHVLSDSDQGRNTLCLLAFMNTQSRNIILHLRISHYSQALFDLFQSAWMRYGKVTWV